MTQEEYEVLIWVLGDRLFVFNILCLSLILAWATALFLYEACVRLLRYIDYKRDREFWTDVLLN